MLRTPSCGQGAHLSLGFPHHSQLHAFKLSYVFIVYIIVHKQLRAWGSCQNNVYMLEEEKLNYFPLLFLSNFGDTFLLYTPN